MQRFGQVGIAIGTLGVIMTMMGLFPGITGVADTPRIGIVQVALLLIGQALLMFGAIVYVKFTFYLGQRSNLAQQVGLRLALTGLLFASLAGLSDILGFGSHIRTETTDIFFGQLQAFGTLASLSLSSVGVLIYAIGGEPNTDMTRTQEMKMLKLTPPTPEKPEDKESTPVKAT
ncbi:hypothetical protein G4Y79_23175 [Phototrophicus methaneseepsis]|uniref:Uncharacterized protein n=1 Tax=Phototrophicus methaneseepsis TaxID=2710758 RepID=A0A7S8E8Y1_9CHLR|nr:hypothetical protein [Phototrophicus methaneseepsis]QPC82554.1 hypothetical protein G4Y79_23175 [Phototrophicus methaneseepsis]